MIATFGQPVTSGVHELLATVDVVRRAGKRCIGHDVNGECCDVGRPDDASDRKLRPQLIAALLELISEQRCRQRRVDEAGGDEVDTNRGELERERSGERRQRRGGRGRSRARD